jgi:succinate-acetate transporter protein
MLSPAVCLQLIKGNTFAGTAFFSYGSFWVAFFISKFISTTPAGTGVPAFKGAFGVGETLIMAWWAVFTFCFFLCTLRKNGCLMTVFGTLTLTFALLAGGQWSTACLKGAGYVGWICGLSAIYTAFAEIWHENLGFMAPGLRPVRYL